MFNDFKKVVSIELTGDLFGFKKINRLVHADIARVEHNKTIWKQWALMFRIVQIIFCLYLSSHNFRIVLIFQQPSLPPVPIYLSLVIAGTPFWGILWVTFYKMHSGLTFTAICNWEIILDKTFPHLTPSMWITICLNFCLAFQKPKV